MYIPKFGYTAEQALHGARLVDPKFTKNGVNTFRNILVQYGLCAPHELISDAQLCTLKQAIQEKQDNETWENCFTRVILNQHMGEIPAEQYFSWTKKMMIEYLLYGVKDGALSVKILDYNEPVARLFINTAIGNFVELGKTVALFEGARGSDYNGFDYEITAPNGDRYYTLGLLNHKANRADMHLFCCQGGRFSPCSTKYYGIFPWRQNSEVEQLCTVCARTTWENENPDGDYEEYMKELEEKAARFSLEKFKKLSADGCETTQEPQQD